jgi:cytochrome c oxidase subunit 4
LLALTGLTFGLAFVHLGAWSMPVALLVASVKSLLVAAFFMHLVEQGATNRIVAAVGIVFLALLCGLMILDVTHRPAWGVPTAAPRPATPSPPEPDAIGR